MAVTSELFVMKTNVLVSKKKMVTVMTSMILTVERTDSTEMTNFVADVINATPMLMLSTTVLGMMSLVNGTMSWAWSLIDLVWANVYEYNVPTLMIF
jgi:hypothetical protein